jgi:Sec-independent protein translocase protein TatA
MFDVSFSELGLVGVVAAFVLGPKEWPGVFRLFRTIQRKLMGWKQECVRTLHEWERETGLAQEAEELKKTAAEVNQQMRIITDENGKKWEAFSVEEVLEDCAPKSIAAGKDIIP